MTSDRLTPVPDAENTPLILPGYRGQEAHGVGQAGHPDDPIDYALEGDPVVYEPKPETPKPQPVYVVSDDRVLRRMRTTRAYATGTPSVALGMFSGRSGAKVRNLSVTAGDRVWLAEDYASCSPQNGYPLDPNAETVVVSESPLYIIADPASPTLVAGNPIPVAVWQDFRVDIH